MKRIWILGVILVIAAGVITGTLFGRLFTSVTVQRDDIAFCETSGMKTIKLTDSDIDSWLAVQQPHVSSRGLSREQYARAQSLGTLLQKHLNMTVCGNWFDFVTKMDRIAEETEILKYHQQAYDQLYSFFLHYDAIKEYDGWEGRIIASPYPESTVSAVGEETADEIWENYRTIGGGNGFYTVNGNQYWQCTTFAWARFWEVYGYRSGARGNGCLHAQEIVRAHPTWFRITYYPVAGATFSTRGRDGNPAGHTGFIEAVKDGYVWVSEGNVGTRGGIRFNYKMSMEEFFTRYPDVIFASPIIY